MTISRRTLVRSIAGGLAFPLPLRFAHAAEFNYKFGVSVATNHPVTQHAENVARRVAAESGGRLQIQVFPNGQLGSDADMQSQVRSGALELMGASPLVLATAVPTAAISGIGFAFRDKAQVFAAMDGPLGKYVQRQLQKFGLVSFGDMWDIGFRQVTNSVRPIHRAEDLKGLKIRVPTSNVYVTLFRALGASPTSLGFAEVYTALETRAVDGQENSLVVIDTAKVHEVQKFCSMTNHVWDGGWIIGSKRTVDALPPKLQEVLQNAFAMEGAAERKTLSTLDETVRAHLIKKGMQINEVDTASFQAALKKTDYYQSLRSKFGDESWKLLEAHVGALT